MGFFSRLRSKKNSEPVETVEPVKPAVIRHVTIKVPPYFKQETGEYHLFFDGEEHVLLPLKSINLDVPEGTHTLRVYSTPETLEDHTEELLIERDMIVAVTINVLKKVIKVQIQ